MTNEHVITKNMIDNEAIINIYYNNEKIKREIKLNTNERIIEIFTYIDIDLSVVEILLKDNISTEFFLLPSIPYMKHFNKLKNQSISIIQYPRGKFGFSNGKIVKIENYQFSYLASTEDGSSGSPIFLKDNTEVIGIHRGGTYNGENGPENTGNFIGPVFRYFKELPKHKYKSNKNLFDNNVDNEAKEKRRSSWNKILFNINENKKIVLEDGSYYIGQIKGGLPDGKGKIYYCDGKVKYEGDFIKGKMEGNGKFNYLNGEYYIGEWKNNKKHGKGTSYHKNGKIIYQGKYIEGYEIRFYDVNYFKNVI